jgi:hypothetical protein
MRVDSFNLLRRAGKYTIELHHRRMHKEYFPSFRTKTAKFETPSQTPSQYVKRFSFSVGTKPEEILLNGCIFHADRDLVLYVSVDKWLFNNLRLASFSFTA